MLLKALEEQDAPAGAVCSWRTEEQCTHVLLIFINIPSVKDPDTCYHTLRSTDDSSIAAAWECSTPVRSAAPAARELASGHQAQLNFAALGVSLFYCCFSRCPEELPSGAQAQVSACLGEVSLPASPYGSPPLLSSVIFVGSWDSCFCWPFLSFVIFVESRDSFLC